jgi:hypothetical protein|tara:strand:- start:206 stop:1003 length:798 start_codon:yes stop_codon:yes gene_type:complete
MDTHKIIKNIKDTGYFKIENFLNEKEVEQIKKMAKNIHKGDGPKQYIPHTYPMLLKKIIKFDFNKLKQGLILKDIVKKRPELKSICNGVFEEKNNLRFIDTYSLKDSQKVNWHTDHMLDKKIQHKLIFFIYLDSVSKNNGSMGYIKNSHKIIYFLKKGLIENKIKLKELNNQNPTPLEGRNFSLEFLLDFIKENYNYLVDCLKNEKTIDSFVANINSIINENETDKFFDEMKPGDAVIFNQSGIHGGTQASQNERAILRLHWWTD